MLHSNVTALVNNELMSVSANAETLGQLHAGYREQDDTPVAKLEVTESVAAALLNAEAALRWLVKHPANIDEVRQAIERVIDDSRRAAHVLKGERYPA
jgi:hypothetical protein